MKAHARLAFLNVRFLIGLLALLAVGSSGFVGLHFFQKHSRAKVAMAAAEAAAAKQDWASATDNYRKYLKSFPDEVDVLRKYVHSTLQNRPLELVHVQMAIEALRRIHRALPDDVETHHELMRLYYLTTDTANLIYIADKRRESDPLAQFYWARGKFKQERFDDAIAALDKLLPKINQPANDDERQLFVEACVLKHMILQKRGVKDPAELIAPLQQAVSVDPNAFEPAVRIEQVKRESQPAGDAALRDARERLLALKPASALHKVLLGLELIGYSEIDRAEELLKEAESVGDVVGPRGFALSADATLAKFMLRSQIDLARGKTQDGVAIVEEAMRQLPDRNYRALTHPDAIRLCLLDRENAIDAGDRARAAKALAKVDELIKDFQETVELVERKPTKQSVAILEALQAQAHGQYHKVIALLEPYNDPKTAENANVFGLLADAYGRVGRTRQAARAIDSYRSAGGRDRREIQIQQLNWLVEHGNWDEAVKLTDRWTDLSEGDVERMVLVQRVRLRSAITGDPSKRAERIAAVAASLGGLRDRHADATALKELEAELAAAQGKFDDALRITRELTDAKPDSPRAWRARADVLAAKGDLAGLIEVLREWTRKTPAEPDAWTRLADALAVHGDYAAAAAALSDGFAATDPAVAVDFKLRAGLLDLDRGETAAGEEKLKALAKEFPSDGMIRRRWLEHTNLSDVATAQRAQPVIDELRKIEGESGVEWKLFQARSILATRPSEAGRREAIALLLPIVEADPQATQAALLLGEAYERNRDWEAAERLYKACRAKNPNDLAVGQRLAQLYKNRGREGEFRELVKSDVFPPSVQVAQATIERIERGDFAGAVLDLDAYLKDHPQDVEARVLRVQLQFRQTSDADAALRELDEADKLHQRHPQVFRTRIAVLEAAKRADEAVRLIDERLSANPDFENYELRGTFREAQGDLSGAEADLRKLIDLKPEDPESHLRLGVFFSDHARLDDAVTLWQTAARKFPNSREIKSALAKSMLARNTGDDRLQAVKIIEEIEQGPGGVRDSELVKLRAFAALDAGGDREPAKKLLEESLKGNPMQLDAHRALIELSLEARDFTAARTRCEQAAALFKDDPTLLALASRIESEAGAPQRAAVLVRECLDKTPGSIECLRQLVPLAESGAVPQAELVERVERAAAQLTKDPEVAIIRARAIAVQGRVAEAISGLEKFQADYADIARVPVLLTLADLAARVPDAAAVAKHLDAANARAPQDDTVRRARVVWLASQNRVEEIAALLRSPEFANAGPYVVAPAAERLLATGDKSMRELAVARLAAVSKPLAADHPGQLDLAGLLFAAGEPDRALAIHEGYFKSRPNEPRLLNDMAWILATAKQKYDEALKLADRGVTLDPTNADLHDTRGTILMAMNKHAPAATDFRAAASNYVLPANKARAWLQAARCSAKLKDGAADLKAAVDAVRELDAKHKMLTDAERTELESLTADAPQ